MSVCTVTLPNGFVLDDGRSWSQPTAPRPRPARRAAAVATRPAPAGRLHLTRRGRGAIVLLVAMLLLAAFAVGRTASRAQVSPAPPAELTSVTVGAGESLWSIAQRIAPDRDPRDVVGQLRRLNELPGRGLHVGQQLLLPAAA